MVRRFRCAFVFLMILGLTSAVGAQGRAGRGGGQPARSGGGGGGRAGGNGPTDEQRAAMQAAQDQLRDDQTELKRCRQQLQTDRGARGEKTPADKDKAAIERDEMALKAAQLKVSQDRDKIRDLRQQMRQHN